jgi:hypothetical protein
VFHDALVHEQRRRLGFRDLALADSPWRVGDLVRAVARLTVGLIVIVASWVGASGTVVWRRQLVWTAIGTGGVVVAATGVFMWLLSGFGMVSRERRDIRRVLAARHARALIEKEVNQFASPEGGLLVWSTGMRHFHRPACDVVKGKPVMAVGREEGRRRGLEPCGMCQS